MKINSSYKYKIKAISILLYGFLLIFLFSQSMYCDAQAVLNNYVQTEKYLNAEGTNSVKSVQYYDGFGRSSILATDGINNQSKYIFTMTEYDMLGRESRVWLPAVGGRSCAIDNKADFVNLSENTYLGDGYGYTDNSYDAMNRLSFKNMAGEVWNSNKKGVKTEYTTNEASSILKYKILSSGELDMDNISYYPAGSLKGVKTTDADGHTLEVFKDILDNVVLERCSSINSADKSTNDTYYVYSKGLLRIVVPPLFSSRKSKGVLYSYKYDSRGRCIEKKLPGCDAIKYWYDNGGRVVFMQDAKLRTDNRYRFYLYDGLGRVAVQGICTKPTLYSYKLNLFPVAVYDEGKSGIENTGYTLSDQSCIGGDVKIEIVNFYDGYRFLSGSHKSDFDFASSSSTCSTGLHTGSIKLASNGEYVYSVMYYNEKGLLSQTKESKLDGVRVSTSTEYTFTNKPSVSSLSVEQKNKKLINSSTVFGYDLNTDKLSKVDIDIAADGVSKSSRIASYDYDKLGRVKTITRGSNAGQITYKYDIHGWTKDITTNSFKEQLHYADGAGTPCFNGNISSLTWNNDTSTNRGYKFKYDDLNRLTSSTYGENDFTDNVGDNDESVSYDGNGNILELYRFADKSTKYGTKTNRVQANYNGNQLSKIRILNEYDNNYHAVQTKPWKTIEYNSSGSLTRDDSRGIVSIEYDDWNNPHRILFDNGNITEYIYSAAGEKLRVIHYTAVPNIKVEPGQTHTLTSDEILYKDSTDYLVNGNLIMTNNKLDMYLFDGGYFKFTTTGNPNICAFYYNQDHLGNNREVIDEEGKVVQKTNYYPFGTPFYDEANTTNASLQPFKYNGKELDLMHGLNTYDYGARQYYAALPTWDRIDPLCECSPEVSPYVYCYDNSVNLIDYKGLFATQTEALDYARHHNVSYSNVHYAKDKDEWFVAFNTTGGGYTSGGTLERRFDAKITENSWWNKLSNFNTDFGTGVGLVGYGLAKPLARSNAYAIIDGTGQYNNSVKPTFKFRNINVESNLKTANRIGSGIKFLGTISAIASLGMTSAEILQGQKNIIGEGGLDLIMIGVGYIPTYGWAISSGYFLGKSALESYNMDFWNK